MGLSIVCLCFLCVQWLGWTTAPLRQEKALDKDDFLCIPSGVNGVEDVEEVCFTECQSLCHCERPLSLCVPTLLTGICYQSLSLYIIISVTVCHSWCYCVSPVHLSLHALLLRGWGTFRRGWGTSRRGWGTFRRGWGTFKIRCCVLIAPTCTLSTPCGERTVIIWWGSLLASAPGTLDTEVGSTIPTTPVRYPWSSLERHLCIR